MNVRKKPTYRSSDRTTDVIWDDEVLPSISWSHLLIGIRSKHTTWYGLFRIFCLRVLHKIESLLLRSLLPYVSKKAIYDTKLETANALEPFFENHVIDEIKMAPTFHDVPSFVLCATRTAWNGVNETDGAKPDGGNVWGSGFALNKHESIVKALGESAERVFLSLYKKEDLLRTSIDAQVKTSTPDTFFNPIEKDTFLFEKEEIHTKPLHWVNVHDERTNKRLAIPAQYVFWNYNEAVQGDEPFLRESNSNGCAAHTTQEKWKLEGLLELLERDGFVVHWLNSNAPDRIDLHSIRSKKIQKLISEIQKYQFELHILDTSADVHIPIYTAVLLDRSGQGPAVTIASSAALNVNNALEKVLTELLGVYTLLRLQDMHVTETTADAEQVKFNQMGRLSWWADMKNQHQIDFFLQGNVVPLHTKTYDPSITSYDELMKVLQAKNFTILSYEVTDPRLDAIGLKCGKMIVPDLAPIYLDEYSRDAVYASPRVKHFNRGKMNITPHPFP